jgi:small conductance mechanosensitive channel
MPDDVIPDELPQEIINLSNTMEELLARLILFLPNLIAALVIFFLTLYLAGFFNRATRRWLERSRANPQAALLMPKLIHWSVIILGTIVALQQVGFSVTAFLAGLGIVGFTIGFALQDISKNFVSGLILWVQQPFALGDIIEITGFTGRVIAIDLRTTELQTFDGRLVLIPNADVVTKPITNFSRVGSRRVEVNASVSAKSDLEQVRTIALQAIDSIPNLLKEPPPQVNFHTFSNSKVDLTAMYWIDTTKADLTLAKDAGITGIKDSFENAGIEIV